MSFFLFIKTLVRSLITYALFLCICAICFIPFMLIVLFPKYSRCNSRLYRWTVAFFHKAIVWATFLPISIVGKEHIGNDPAIIIANHQSALDVVFLGALIGVHSHTWLVLDWVAQLPVLGFFIRRVVLVVDSSSAAARARCTIEAVRTAKEQSCHVIIFPEGGRYLEGVPHKFMRGFALIAKKTDLPVIPVYFENLQKVYPPFNFLINWYPVRIVVGEPMRIQEGETTEEFRDRVHAWYLNQVR